MRSQEGEEGRDGGFREHRREIGKGKGAEIGGIGEKGRGRGRIQEGTKRDKKGGKVLNQA